MSDTPKVYQKTDSFVEIRQSNPDREAVYARIRRLQRRLEDYQLKSNNRG